MSQIRPFQLLHYPFSDPLFNQFIAPPYDVITTSKREELLGRNRHNSIRIILGDPSLLSEKERNDPKRYEEAKKTFQTWQKDGTLQLDPTPSFLVLEDTFEWFGKKTKRVGLL